MNVTEEHSNHMHMKMVKPEDLPAKPEPSRREKRGQRRAMLRAAGKRWSASPMNRFPSGVKTGTTPHFKMWTADLQLRRTLEIVKVGHLANVAVDANTAAGYAALASAGFKNVFQLTRASRKEILAVAGFGPKRLDAVKGDLAAHNVQVGW